MRCIINKGIVFESIRFPEDLKRESFLDEFDATLKQVDEARWKSHYLNYAIYQGNPGFGTSFFRIAEEYAASSAQETKAPDLVVQDLVIRYEMDPTWQVRKRMASNRVPVIMVIADIDRNLEYIKEDMDTAGYFLGFHRNITVFGMPFIELQFEPMFEVEQTDKVRLYEVEF